MACLHEPFVHDIFVSYAHGPADRRGVQRLKHWSERLVDELHAEIVDLLPEFEALDIFIDKQLDPTQPLTNQMREQVSRSGLLLVFMSEHYLHSAWCQQEREWFESEVARRQAWGELVLVVRVQPINHHLWPTFLKDERGHVVLGFQFHQIPMSDGEAVQPYGWPEPLPRDRAYYEVLGKLASIVTQRLRQLKRAQELEDKARQIRTKGKPPPHLASKPDKQRRRAPELEDKADRPPVQTRTEGEPPREPVLQAETPPEIATTRNWIFLAHAREDKAHVRKLYEDLKARGFDPWLDEKDLRAGQIWKAEIPKAIRAAKLFLACLSSRSVNKVGYVQNEFRQALVAYGERPPGSIYLIPARLDQCDVPDLQIPDRGLSLQDFHSVDLWEEGGFDRLVADLQYALGIDDSASLAAREMTRRSPGPPV